MAQTLYWYDLETFGLHPSFDRVAQFAGVRTNDKLEEIGEPLVLYCRIPQDYLPDPRACLINGISPQKTLSQGLSEYEFILRINAEFSQPGTCVTGYNNIRFDDEFVRWLYYRNFFDPYLREYKNHSSRWDLLPLVQAASDLRPEGLTWPRKENGRHSFKLTDLSAANGIGHENAHQALADVRATIALARALKEAQPKLFRYAFKIRRKEEIKKRFDLAQGQPFLSCSGIYNSIQGCTALVYPLTVNPAKHNSLIVFDLREDPADLLKLSVEEIRDRLFTVREQQDPEKKRPAVTEIFLNQCPFVAPPSIMDRELSLRLGIDLPLCLERAEQLKKSGDLIQKILKVYQGSGAEEWDGSGVPGSSGRVEPEPSARPRAAVPPELALYAGGFFPDQDLETFAEVHRLAGTGQIEKAKELSFKDPRIPELLKRFRGRNFFDALSDEEKRQWKSYCAGRLLFALPEGARDIKKYDELIASLSTSEALSPGEKRILKDLDDYGKILKDEVLEYHE